MILIPGKKGKEENAENVAGSWLMLVILWTIYYCDGWRCK
jgi:hypothetical protein